ncbi:MAG: response regulator [Deltaproteobacteria bacterium]|nr:MAG: response regulator [Deltaproteobacteria bacterium]
MPAPRILVLDDNPELLTLLSSAFEEAGYQVQTAARGRTALELVRKERPDLVIVDVLLPDLMGFDVAEALKRLKIPFIFMSGVHKGGKVSSNATGRYGALAYFEKPFERTALLAAVRKAVPFAEPHRKVESWDVDVGPQVTEAAEAMQLTGHIDLVGHGVVAGTSPLRLKPMDRDQMQRLRDAKPISSPPVMHPMVQSTKVTTGPIAGEESGEALQNFPQRDGVRKGELKDNLPHLLAAFYQAKETGELGLQKGQVKKIIYFEGGMPVFALSNLVADRLGQFLVRAGKIDEDTLRHAAEEAAATRQRTGDVLILMGALTEEERLYYVGQQIKSILYSVFAWEEGSFNLSFQARARKEAIKLDIHPANLIMRGVKKLYKADRLRRLMPDSVRPVPSQEPYFNLSDVELQAWEAHLLPRCDGSRTVAEIIKRSGKAEPDVLGTLVGLTSLRVIDLR